MKKISIFLLAFGLTGACLAQPVVKEASPELDELMRGYATLNQFNGSILVAKGNKILYQKEFGVKDAAAGVPNDINTLFRIYSVTKTFTSTVIFKLIEEDRLSLNDRLSKFYPSFPKGDSITIEQLLSHTSGIYDYTQGNDMKDETEASFIKFLSAKPLNFSPGKGWDYSNSGYWLLGFIVAKVTGISYEDAVKKYIFLPCKMSNSGFDFKTLKHADKATGYTEFADQEKKPSEDIDPPGPYAAGAIYSTTGDLYRYAKALLSDQLISRKSLSRAWLPDPLNSHYGLGWQLAELGGKRVVSHGGGGPGFRSNFALIPEDSLCIIQLTNNENTDLGMLTRSVTNILYGKQVKIPFAVAVDTTVLRRYVGYYELKPGLSLHVTEEDGKLMVQANGQAKRQVFAEKDNYFYSLEAEAYLEFILADTGLFKEVKLHGGDRSLLGFRYTPSWGILGSATEIGWNDEKDIPMRLKNGSQKVWEIRGVRLRSGVFKFRFNNDWSLNYGKGEGSGELKLLGKDIAVEEGVYDIEVDFSDEGRVVWKMMKVE